MNKTLERYRQAIQDGSVDPVRRWDGRTSGTLLDCRNEHVPLLALSMETFALTATPARIETGQREWAIVPIQGRWEAEVSAGGQTVRFSGDRTGGPLADWPDRCSAQAVYVPRQAELTLSGSGEAIGFSAPAFEDRPPVRLAAGPDTPLVSRGSGVWRRDVITLAGPPATSSNLVVGETYSPPGLWSGTPLHVHDQTAPDQSDHEEIYYHLGSPPADPDDNESGWGPFGVQLLFDDRGLDRAYVIHHRTAFAIPGGAHPVVAGPAGPMMYVWCLAAESPQPLRMRDVPEFAWLKAVGEIIDRLESEYARLPLTHGRVERLAADCGLTAEQARVLELHLHELGFVVTD